MRRAARPGGPGRFLERLRGADFDEHAAPHRGRARVGAGVRRWPPAGIRGAERAACGRVLRDAPERGARLAARGTPRVGGRAC